MQDRKDLITKIDAVIYILRGLEAPDTPSPILGQQESWDRTWDKMFYNNFVFPFIGLILIWQSLSIVQSNENGLYKYFEMAILVSFFQRFLSFYQHRNQATNFYRNSSLSNQLYRLIEIEKDQVLWVTSYFDINLNEITIDYAVKLLLKIRNDLDDIKNNESRKTAFMMGFHTHLGENSPVRMTFFSNETFERGICRTIFELADFSEISKNKRERWLIKTLPLFFYKEDYQDKDERVISTIFDYLNLNREPLSQKESKLTNTNK